MLEVSFWYSCDPRGSFDRPLKRKALVYKGNTACVSIEQCLISLSLVKRPVRKAKRSYMWNESPVCQ